MPRPCHERWHAQVLVTRAFPSLKARIGKYRNSGRAGLVMPCQRGALACGTGTRHLASMAGIAMAESNVGLLMEVQTLPRHGRVMWGVILGAMGTMGGIVPEAMGIIPGAMGIMGGFMPGAMGDNVRSKGDNGAMEGTTPGALGDNRVGTLGVLWHGSCGSPPYSPTHPMPLAGEWEVEARCSNALPINFSFSVGVSKQKGEKNVLVLETVMFSILKAVSKSRHKDETS